MSANLISLPILAGETAIDRDGAVLHGGTLLPLPCSTDQSAQPQHPCHGNVVVSSPFHPFVLAWDCLQLWLTPFGIQRSTVLRTQVGDFAAHHLIATQLISIEPKTREVYGAGLLHFTQYCDMFGVSEGAHMLASDDLLGTFASSGAAKVVRGSIEQWVAGLRLWHSINGAPWLGGDCLKRTLIGVGKVAPSSSRHLSCAPVTHEHLLALLSALDFSNSFDIAMWAVASVAFGHVVGMFECTRVNFLSTDLFTTQLG